MGRPERRLERRIVIACTPGDAITGARLARAVGDAGVSCALHQRTPSLKAEKDAFDAATPLVLVWSRNAAIDPALLREASNAAARDTLVLVRLDAARIPPGLRAAPVISMSLARPQGSLRALLALLAAAPASQPRKGKSMTPSSAPRTAGARDERSTWRCTLLLTVILFGLAWSAYVVAMGKPPVDLMAFIAGLQV